MDYLNFLDSIFGPRGAPIVMLFVGILAFVYVLIGPTLWSKARSKRAHSSREDESVLASLLVANGELKTVRSPSPSSRFKGADLLSVQEGNAAVLERGGKVTRVVGAGITHLQPFERVQMPVYLGVRAEKIIVKNVITHDGMVLETFRFLVFHKLSSGDESARSGKYRFDAQLILEKVWNSQGTEWIGAIKAISQSVARDVIAAYNFEDIIKSTSMARRQLQEQLTDRINDTTHKVLGVIVLATGIEAIEISEEARRVFEEKYLSDVKGLFEKTVWSEEGEKISLFPKTESESLVFVAPGGSGKTMLRHMLLQQWKDVLKLTSDQAIANPDLAGEDIAEFEEIIERLEASEIGWNEGIKSHNPPRKHQIEAAKKTETP